MPDQLPTAYHQHDHTHCVERALTSARALCKERGVKLTRIRERVLTLVWDSHQPLGAYAILEKLNELGEGHPAPPTVYRALDFLQEQGLVHRLASLNAYIGCCEPGHNHQGHFLICRQCHTTVEASSPDISDAIQSSAASRDFSAESECVEIVGICPNCREHADEH